jgi:hypothetical protein
MNAGLALNSGDLHRVEVLVGWNTKVKLIHAIVGKENAVLLAKKLYKKHGIRPPNGMPGAAASERRSLVMSQCFVALSNIFLQLRAFGISSEDAMIAVFEVYMKLRNHDKELCNVNIWLSLARDLEAGNAGLYRCLICGGGHLWQQGVYRVHRACMWCRLKLEMPQLAVDAANAGLALQDKTAGSSVAGRDPFMSQASLLD